MLTAKRDACLDGAEHAWVRRSIGRHGHDEVHCARCMRCLGVDAMLRAYVELHGGTIRP